MTEAKRHCCQCEEFSADILTGCPECDLPLTEGRIFPPSKQPQETYSISFLRDNVHHRMRRWVCEWDIPIHPDLGCADIEEMIDEMGDIIGRKCDDGIHFIRVIRGRKTSCILTIEGAGIERQCDWCLEFRNGMKRMAEKKGLVFEQKGGDFEKCGVQLEEPMEAAESHQLCPRSTTPTAPANRPTATIRL